uniref:Uncharacterized protein n=1 Tax=Mycena chlorophos TaxID=658473 RepID=A0ABQ0KY06_MYCCL|nr:predicted protein [Mycena chlorophos]
MLGETASWLEANNGPDRKLPKKALLRDMLSTTTSAGAFPDTASLQGGFPSFAFTQNLYVAGPSSQNSLHGGSADPNSVELFRANIHMAQEDVLRVHELAKRALDDLQNAYSPGWTPTHADADMAALRQSLEHLATLLRQSGVGGLPLLSSPNAVLPSEDSEALLNVTNRTLQEERRGSGSPGESQACIYVPHLEIVPAGRVEARRSNHASSSVGDWVPVLIQSPVSAGVVPSFQSTKIEGDTDQEDTPCVVHDSLLYGGNPTGATVTVEYRRGVLALVREHNLIMLDEDPYHYLYFRPVESRPPSYSALERFGGHPIGHGLRMRGSAAAGFSRSRDQVS